MLRRANRLVAVGRRLNRNLVPGGESNRDQPRPTSFYLERTRERAKSEREVTGVVFALAGYLVYDVFETVPFVLLDSLEAIDADRITKI